MSRAHHTDVPFPHDGCCPDCRALEICNCCGHPAPKATRCTNGHCNECHQSVCTPGGISGPGHGFGSACARAAAVTRRQQQSLGLINFDAWVHADDAVTMQDCADVLAHGRGIIRRLMTTGDSVGSRLTTAEILFLQDVKVVTSALQRLIKAVQS